MMSAGPCALPFCLSDSAKDSEFRDWQPPKIVIQDKGWKSTLVMHTSGPLSIPVNRSSQHLAVWIQARMARSWLHHGLAFLTNSKRLFVLHLCKLSFNVFTLIWNNYGPGCTHTGP